MSTVRSLIIMLMLHAVLSACAFMKAYPERSDDPQAELTLLGKYFEPAKIQDYDRDTTPSTKRALRNEIVNGRMRAIDIQFNLFQQNLFREGVTTNIAGDFITLGLGAATATVGGAAAKAALGATSGGIAGAKTSIDKNLFFEKTMPALLAQMIANRKAASVKIKDGLTKEVDEYSLQQALTDLEDYYYAGTLPGAIVSISQQAGAAASQAEVAIEAVRTKEFVDKQRQARIQQILDKITNLPNPKALELATNPPVKDREIDQLVSKRDPGNSRASNATAAKEILKMMAVFSKRSDADLNAWEAALKAVE